MSLGTKSGAAPYCSRTIVERKRTKQDYERYIKRTLEKAVITEEDSEAGKEQEWFACSLDFRGT